MKGFLLLADAARAHPDGTFSLLRGGVDQVFSPRTQPFQFRGSVVARIMGDLSEAGAHDFQLRILNEDGQAIVPEITGQFSIPDGGGVGVAIMDFALILPSYGRYTFALNVDKQKLDSWEVRASETPENQSQGGGQP